MRTRVYTRAPVTDAVGSDVFGFFFHFDAEDVAAAAGLVGPR